MTSRAAIIGAGVIGAGWAARFLLMGWDVNVCDPDPDAELTAVKLSTWPEPLSDPRKIDTLRAIHAIKAAL